MLIFSKSKSADAGIINIYLKVDRIVFKIVFHFQLSEKFNWSSVDMLRTVSILIVFLIDSAIDHMNALL